MTGKSQPCFLLLPRIRVQNANAISSPLTYGFPSVTAFMGLMWALGRRCRAREKELGFRLFFKKVGVIAHETQIFKTGQRFHLTRNPLGKGGGDGRDWAPQPFQEEGRMHMTVSLLFDLKVTRENGAGDLSEDEGEYLAQAVRDVLEGMRIAGGSVMPRSLEKKGKSSLSEPVLLPKGKFKKERWPREKFRLLPGFALRETPRVLEARKEELRQEKPGMENPDLEAWLSLATPRWKKVKVEGEEKWENCNPGWTVPLSVGYRALGPICTGGAVKNARDGETDFQPVESIYSIGEWVGPHRISDPEEILWECRNEPEGEISKGEIYRAVMSAEGQSLGMDGKH